MKQTDLNRAVAQATGETISEIKRLGFVLEETPDDQEPSAWQLEPYALDWDELEAQRRGTYGLVPARSSSMPHLLHQLTVAEPCKV